MVKSVIKQAPKNVAAMRAETRTTSDAISAFAAGMTGAFDKGVGVGPQTATELRKIRRVYEGVSSAALAPTVTSAQPAPGAPGPTTRKATPTGPGFR